MADEAIDRLKADIARRLGLAGAIGVAIGSVIGFGFGVGVGLGLAIADKCWPL